MLYLTYLVRTDWPVSWRLLAVKLALTGDYCER
jgi:hypothetical protein